MINSPIIFTQGPGDCLIKSFLSTFLQVKIELKTFSTIRNELNIFSCAGRNCICPTFKFDVGLVSADFRLNV